MCRVEFAAIAVRILALGMGVRALVLLGGFAANVLADFFYVGWQFYPSIYGSALLEAAVWGTASVYCRQRTEKLAWSMYADDQEATASAELGLKADELLTLSSVVAGLFVVVPALQSLAVEAVGFVTHGKSWELYWNEPLSRSRLLSIVVQGALGFGLIVGARAIAARLMPVLQSEPGDEAGDRHGDAPPTAPTSSAAEEPTQ